MKEPAAPKPKQPRGLFLLFGVEMWERFSYYGMRALLIFFIAAPEGEFGWSKASASMLYGVYGFLVYLTPLAGGMLADRVLGTHRAVVFGGAIIAAGHFLLALPARATFLFGLLLIALGTGLFKPNAATMVGQLYRDGDPRRDSGFTIFYLGINVGAFLGPIVCGFLAASPRFGWHYGFAAAGVGMVIGLGMYLALRRRVMAGIGEAPPRAPERARANPNVAPLTREEWHRVCALLIIALFVVPFWTAYEQTGSSMALFALERTDRVVLGYEFPASWFQSVNPVAILVLAPVFAWLWGALARRHREPSTAVKMSFGLLFVGAGFVLLVGAARLSEGGARVSPAWLTGTFVLHTMGELCLSPIGLSLVTKLAPERRASLLMGVWFAATGLAELSAGFLAALTERFARGEVFHLFGGQADFFFMFVVSSCAAGVLLLLVARPVTRLMHGRDDV